jgi:hypothetical protein
MDKENQVNGAGSSVFMLGAGLMAAQEKIAASMERAEDAAKAARLRQNDII